MKSYNQFINEGYGFIIDLNRRLLDACSALNFQLIKKLIEKGADPNYIEIDNGVILTPLYCCTRHKRENEITEDVVGTVEFLLKCGADPSVKVSGGSGDFMWGFGSGSFYSDLYNDPKYKDLEDAEDLGLFYKEGIKSYNQFINEAKDQTEMHISSKNLTSLPELPKSLKELYCYDNLLISLPELPKNLIRLDCYDNQLTSLPELPKSLKSLDCDNNKLTSLPELPMNLTELYCNNNLLTSLPELPKSLNKLYCFNNPWKEPLDKEIVKKFNISYSKENIEWFSLYEFQKEYLTRTGRIDMIEEWVLPEIKEEFKELYDAGDLGLMYNEDIKNEEDLIIGNIHEFKGWCYIYLGKIKNEYYVFSFLNSPTVVNSTWTPRFFNVVSLSNEGVKKLKEITSMPLKDFLISNIDMFKDIIKALKENENDMVKKMYDKIISDKDIKELIDASDLGLMYKEN